MYFVCADKHGVLCAPKKVTLLPEAPDIVAEEMDMEEESFGFH